MSLVWPGHPYDLFVLATPHLGETGELFATSATPSPSPSPSVVQAPPADPLQAVGAVLAIAFALAAAILGYRIIRGGRGL